MGLLGIALLSSPLLIFFPFSNVTTTSKDLEFSALSSSSITSLPMFSWPPPPLSMIYFSIFFSFLMIALVVNSVDVTKSFLCCVSFPDFSVLGIQLFLHGTSCHSPSVKFKFILEFTIVMVVDVRKVIIGASVLAIGNVRGLLTISAQDLLPQFGWLNLWHDSQKWGLQG